MGPFGEGGKGRGGARALEWRQRIAALAAAASSNLALLLEAEATLQRPHEESAQREAQPEQHEARPVPAWTINAANITTRAASG